MLGVNPPKFSGRGSWGAVWGGNVLKEESVGKIKGIVKAKNTKQNGGPRKLLITEKFYRVQKNEWLRTDRKKH